MTKAALLLLLALAGISRAEPEAAPACLIVYGQARNIGEPPENEAWDRINLRFNGLVTARLKAAGLDAQALVFKVGVTDPAAAVQLLRLRAEASGCVRVVDTAVFADANGSLVVRLRVHPLLSSLGPVATPQALRIGTALYTGQSEFDLNARTLERLKLEALAASMVEGYLAKEAPGSLKRQAGAASPSQ